MTVKYYPLGEHAPGYALNEQGDLRVTPTGEMRPPRKGEWYLSGAIVAGYIAPNDYSDRMPYYIARICKVRLVTTVTEVVLDARNGAPGRGRVQGSIMTTKKQVPGAKDECAWCKETAPCESNRLLATIAELERKLVDATDYVRELNRIMGERPTERDVEAAYHVGQRGSEGDCYR